MDQQTNDITSSAQARFLQIHTLTGYSATLLNRDDIGRAKRLPFGGTDRIRVSSQCLKRHWRQAAGEWSLTELGSGASTRSRRIFSDIIADRLIAKGLLPEQIMRVLMPIRSVVLGESIKAAKARSGKDSTPSGSELLKELRTEQVIVLGPPEIDFLTKLAWELGDGDAKAVTDRVKDYFKDKATKDNLRSLQLGAGLDAALFGRMVTSDILARTDAAIHVAHSFTVHAEEAEPDYFSALDDLVAAEGELGSGHINTSELTSGLFYGYVVVDLAKLVSNLSGDRTLASETIRRLVPTIATVSPGAKLGSTAPYACAELVFVEAGSSQPRSLANAFMVPVDKRNAQSGAAAAIGDYLERYDNMYGQAEIRKFATMIDPAPSHTGARVSLVELSRWASSLTS